MQFKLYKARKDAKMTQDDLANYLGVSRVTYGKKERGEVPFLMDEMFLISELFGKPLTDIFVPRGNQIGYLEKVKQ